MCRTKKPSHRPKTKCKPHISEHNAINILHNIRSVHREQPELSNSQLLELTLVGVGLDDVDMDVGLFSNCFRIISVLLPWYKCVLVCILQMSAGMITNYAHTRTWALRVPATIRTRRTDNHTY